MVKESWRSKWRYLLAVLAVVALFLVMAGPVMAADTGTLVSDLWANFSELANGWKLVTLVALMFAVLALGVVNALLKSTFKLSVIADIARKRIVPGIGGYYLLCIAGAANADLAVLATSMFGVVTTALVGDFLAGLKELGVPGIPRLPEFFTGTR